jgi:hypothetical protein
LSAAIHVYVELIELVKGMFTVLPLQIVADEALVITGKGLIVIVDVAVAPGHVPDGAIVFVTVYVPAVLAVKLTCPVLVLINDKPAGDAVNVPDCPAPVYVGDGLVPFLQNGVPE